MIENELSVVGLTGRSPDSVGWWGKAQRLARPRTSRPWSSCLLSAHSLGSGPGRSGQDATPYGRTILTGAAWSAGLVLGDGRRDDQAPTWASFVGTGAHATFAIILEP
jgi:hypothetical protein